LTGARGIAAEIPPNPNRQEDRTRTERSATTESAPDGVTSTAERLTSHPNGEDDMATKDHRSKTPPAENPSAAAPGDAPAATPTDELELTPEDALITAVDKQRARHDERTRPRHAHDPLPSVEMRRPCNPPARLAPGCHVLRPAPDGIAASRAGRSRRRHLQYCSDGGNDEKVWRYGAWGNAVASVHRGVWWWRGG